MPTPDLLVSASLSYLRGAFLFSYGFTVALLLYRGQLGVAPSPTNVRMSLSTELLTQNPSSLIESLDLQGLF